MNQRTGVIVIIILILLIIAGIFLFTGDRDDLSPDVNTINVQDMVPNNNATGTGQVATTSNTTGTTTAVKSFTVTASNFSFAPNSMTVKKGDTVKITLVNSDGFHDFVLDEFGVRTKQLKAGEQETVTFVASRAGTFEYYCSVGEHRQMGMKGTLTVTE